MPSVTVSYHYNDHTTEEGKPIDLAIFVTGILTPLVPAKTNGPPEDCYPEEGGTFEILQVKPMWYYLAGEEQLEDIERYRVLTGFEGAWEDLVDNDYCTELALEEYDDHLERAREEHEDFREDKAQVWRQEALRDEELDRAEQC